MTCVHEDRIFTFLSNFFSPKTQSAGHLEMQFKFKVLHRMHGVKHTSEKYVLC